MKYITNILNNKFKDYNLNNLLYYAFINDDIKFYSLEINKTFPAFDENSIYSDIVYRKNKYIAGFNIDNSIKVQKFNKLPEKN